MTSYPVPRNTHTRREPNGDIVHRLYETDIVTFHADGTFTLNTGGWPTVTTSAAMTDLLPRGWLVYSRDNRWRISGPDPSRRSLIEHFDFFDGMRIDPNGPRIVNPNPTAQPVTTRSGYSGNPRSSR